MCPHISFYSKFKTNIENEGVNITLLTVDYLSLFNKTGGLSCNTNRISKLKNISEQEKAVDILTSALYDFSDLVMSHSILIAKSRKDSL